MKTTTLSRSLDFSREGRSNIYIIAAFLALLAVVAGFSFTYVGPMMRGTFTTGRTMVHLHGALYFLWILLFIGQPILVQRGNVKIHRQIGVFGFILAGIMIVFGAAVAITGVRLNTPTMMVGGLQPKQFLIVPLTDMVLFATFLSFSLANLKRSDYHKRLMLMATVALLPAAFGRMMIMLGVNNPAIIILANEALLLVAIVHDLITRKKIHPAYIWGGSFMIIVHLVRFPIGASGWWSSIAEWIVGS
ncbi:MAG TPA: hypothetical protein VFU05_00465 [Cyclobacteriaceae bacterium]|nr:hypothetical protein [Cyclobacteriaceae bacterium]